MSLAHITHQLAVLRGMMGIEYSPNAERDARIGPMLAERLAGMVNDVRELGYYRGTGTTREWRCASVQCGDADCQYCDWAPITFPNAYFYNKRTLAKLPLQSDFSEWCSGVYLQGDAEVYAPESCPTIPPPGTAIRLADLRMGERWWAIVYVFWIGGAGGETQAQAVPLFVVREWRETSTAQSLAQAVAFWLAVVSFVVPGVGAVIGTAVFGAELAAAYPTLVSLATNTALNTALNGGDVAAAVTKAVAGLVGAQVGTFAGTTVDSQLIGRMTGAATTAAITGGDPAQSAALAALNFTTAARPAAPDPVAAGITAAAALPSTPAQVDTMNGDEYGYGLETGDSGYDYVFGGQVIDMGTGFDAQALDLGGDTFVEFSDDGSLFYPGDMVQVGGDGFDPEGGFVGPPEPYSPELPANLPPPSPTDGNGFDWGDALGNVTAFALKAYQVYQATHPQSNNAPIRAPGPSQVVNPGSGTITTRSPTGQVTSGRPPVGQTVAAADGSLVTNNGNGTYTVIRPDGTTITAAYPVAGAAAGATMDNTRLLMLGGLALGGLYLLTQRR